MMYFMKENRSVLQRNHWFVLLERNENILVECGQCAYINYLKWKIDGNVHNKVSFFARGYV